MYFNGKRILIVGGAGFIGSNLAIRMVAEGAKVLVADALIPEMGGELFNLQPVRSQTTFIQADFRKCDGIDSLVSGQEIIFNLMGQVSHQDSIFNPKLDQEINIAAQLNLLESCRRVNPGAAVIFSSTRQVYGIPQYLPVDECHPISPVDFNGVSNWAGEQYHLLYGKIFGLKTVCLRLTNTYGPRQLIKHSRQGFIGWFLNRALLGETIPLFGGGGQMRDLNHVSDVVEALLRASRTEACFGQVYNLSGDQTSLKEIAEILIGISGKGKIVSQEFPETLKKIDIGNYLGDSRKFAAVTGWKPEISLAKGLRETFEYFRENLPHYLGRNS